MGRRSRASLEVSASGMPAGFKPTNFESIAFKARIVQCLSFCIRNMENAQGAAIGY